MSRKTDLVTNTVRCITNIANTRDTLVRNIELFVDNGYTSGGSNPLTDAELETFDLTYAQFASIKDFSDAFETFLAANNREMEKIINIIRTVIA
jgi:hypothetical protein